SGDHAGAVEVYREALRLGAEGGVAEERLAIICFNLGWAAFRLRDLETAEENFLRALGVYEEAEFQPRVALQALSCLCEIAIVQGARAKQKAYAARLEKARKRTRARGESPELILSGPVVRE
ncbi:MAG TPA: hypothetical protein VEQ60_14955, partial [Longimicrobium sp.]|nr:hypothetical protein [Longimicrobium sp.]